MTDDTTEQGLKNPAPQQQKPIDDLDPDTWPEERITAAMRCIFGAGMGCLLAAGPALGGEYIARHAETPAIRTDATVYLERVAMGMVAVIKLHRAKGGDC